MVSVILKVTHKNDSTRIGVMWYGYDIKNKDIYGGIYSTSTVDKVCPVGWHVSTRADWVTLIDYIGGASTAGKLIETGTGHWSSPNEYASNETGFSALPAGHYRKTYPHNEKDEEGNWITPESFEGLGEETYFWAPNLDESSNDPSSYYDLSDFIGLRFDIQNIGYVQDLDSNDVTICGSIRCVKD